MAEEEGRDPHCEGAQSLHFWMELASWTKGQNLAHRVAKSLLEPLALNFLRSPPLGARQWQGIAAPLCR